MRWKMVEARLAAGYTQQQVADALGVCRSAVSGWEVGRTSPDMVDTIKLKKLYNVSDDEIFLRETEKKKLK